MEHVRWDDRPSLRRPVLVAAFEGWNDAAEAASTAARYLGEQWGARPFADVDPEEFYDFSSTRPQIRLTDGFTRHVLWPANRLWAAPLPTQDRDAIVLVGVEPQLRWRTFCQAIVDVARELDVQMMVTLGALLADVPHTRPVQMTGTAADRELVRQLGLERSRYEGPTGIVGVLHDAFRAARMPSASLWAAVPHYVPATPSPKAALALVRAVTRLMGTSVPTADLEMASTEYERQVSDVVTEDEELIAYVERLEHNVDAGTDDMEVLSGEALAAELERFLREEHGD